MAHSARHQPTVFALTAHRGGESPNSEIEASLWSWMVSCWRRTPLRVLGRSRRRPGHDGSTRVEHVRR